LSICTVIDEERSNHSSHLISPHLNSTELKWDEISDVNAP